MGNVLDGYSNLDDYPEKNLLKMEKIKMVNRNIKVKEDNILINPDPIWNKSPKDLKDEDYISFYKELHPFSEDPVFLDTFKCGLPI